MIDSITKKISNFILYGVVFSLIASISSLFSATKYTLTPPSAHADIPYSGSSDSSSGGGSGGSDSSGAGASDSCDGAGDAGDACDSF